LKIHNLKIKQDIKTLDQAVLEGFTQPQKSLSSMYFYDDKGSVLFQKITQQDDYYLTNSEHEILSTYSQEIAAQFGAKEIDIIELGVGDGHKTKLILSAFDEAKIKVNFYPIDISEKAIDLLKNYTTENKYLEIHAVVADYESGVKYISDMSKHQKLVLFLGSNIGNFKQLNSQRMLEKISSYLAKNDQMLIGFDLKKDRQILTDAYNDEAGITRDFNLNILKRMNNELGANFNTDFFSHLGIYNEDIGAMESFLVSNIEQDIYFKKIDKTFSFKKEERIHLEFSHKYSIEDIKLLAKQASFQIKQNYTDKKQYFIDSLWKKV
jgi:dimethylhistidine N-methyltransferase